jgi:hypothetical protein
VKRLIAFLRSLTQLPEREKRVLEELESLTLEGGGH